MTEQADQLHHNKVPAHYIVLVQNFFGTASHHPGLSAPLQPRFDSLPLLAFPKDKITIGREEICECDRHTVHKLSQRRLTADWLAPRQSDCSGMHSKFSSEWLPSYIKATRTFLEIPKRVDIFWTALITGYLPCNLHHQTAHCDHKQGKCKFFWNFATHLQDSTLSELRVLQHEQAWRIRRI